MSHTLFFGGVTPSVINKQNEEFESKPQKKEIGISVRGKKFAHTLFQGMCETINVTLKSEFLKETELKMFYTAVLVTTHL
jgi:hypothetical protein